MKILLKSLSLGLILTVIFSLIPFTAQCKSLEKDIFRLHILANSDLESDQELKLKVRDKVLSYTEDLYKDCETKEDTIKVTENNLVNILNVKLQICISIQDSMENLLYHQVFMMHCV